MEGIIGDRITTKSVVIDSIIRSFEEQVKSTGTLGELFTSRCELAVAGLRQMNTQEVKALRCLITQALRCQSNRLRGKLESAQAAMSEARDILTKELQ